MTLARTPETAVIVPEQSQRRAQIDGLRALAMVGVLYVHLYDKSPQTENLRVSLFFVVSGFLITHILYTAKERGGHIHVLNFYIRRALRLFPALAILVVVASIFDIAGFRSSALWHLAQMSNIYFLITREYQPWVVGHIWSLNVLEQFYLIWPPVILFLSLGRIYMLTLAIILVTSFVHVHAYSMGMDWYWSHLIFASGPIAFGAFAYLLQRNTEVRKAATSRPALALCLAVFISPLFMWEDFGRSATYYILCMPALAAIVTGAFAGYSGPIGWVLASPVSAFLSKISYGVYIYHVLVWWMMGEFYPSLMTPGATTFLIVSTITLIVALASWYLVEEPISRLKRHFPTATRQPVGQDRADGLSADAIKRPA